MEAPRTVELDYWVGGGLVTGSLRSWQRKSFAFRACVTQNSIYIVCYQHTHLGYVPKDERRGGRIA